MSAQDAYNALRRQGYSAWSAGTDLRLTSREIRVCEVAYKKARSIPDKPAPLPHPRFYDAWCADDEPDAAHVAACLRLGGFPTSRTIGRQTVWVGHDGRIWRGT